MSSSERCSTGRAPDQPAVQHRGRGLLLLLRHRAPPAGEWRRHPHRAGKRPHRGGAVPDEARGAGGSGGREPQAEDSGGGRLHDHSPQHEQLLEKEYDVALAESGVAAIRTITLNRPDLVLLDLRDAGLRRKARI